MQVSRAGSRTSQVLYEEFDHHGAASFASLARGSALWPVAEATEFYGTNGGGAATLTVRTNGTIVRQVTSAVANAGQNAQKKHFPLRRRWNVAPIFPSAYRKYHRHTYEVTAWRDTTTAVVNFEVGLCGNDTILPSEAFTDPKFAFRSLLGENAGNWQGVYRLIDNGALTRIATAISPLVPARMKWVFETGPTPRLFQYLNDVLILTAQDGTAIALPNGLADNLTISANRFSPSFGMEGAIGDLGNVTDSYYKLELLS